MYNYKNRKEVPERYKWDLTDFFKNDNEFNKLFELTKKDIKTLKKFKGCTKDPKEIYLFLKKYNELNANVLILYVYSYLKNDEELGNSVNIERKSKSNNLFSEIGTNTSFFEEELLNLDSKEYKNLFKEYKELKEYKSFLDKIYRNKEHILTEQEENIITELTSKMNNFSNISSDLINKEHNYGKIIIDGKEETITINNYHRIIKNKDRKIRKEAYEKLFGKLEEYSGVSAGLLNSYVQGNNAVAKLHKFSNAWECKLFGLNLENKVFKTLVETVEKNTDSLKKYLKLRKKILNLDKLELYDLGVDLFNNTKEYTIEEAQKLIKESLKPLGNEYIEKLNTIFEKRYIDYMGYKGKCSGGYSFSTSLKPSRILMSYNGDLNSISTIAHESGHNIHHQFIMENNPLQYRNASNLVAEVASLTNECLLSSYIIKNSKNKDEKIEAIENMIRVIRSNLFGAAREGKIEEEMYTKANEGGTLTKEYLNNLVEKSYEKYNGKEINSNPLNSISWITRSHYYMNFYLYSYAISISIAINVAKEILKGNENMLNNYIKFLSTGSDKWPEEAFKILGIDLTDSLVYKEAIDYFKDLTENLKHIYFDKEVNESE